MRVQYMHVHFCVYIVHTFFIIGIPAFGPKLPEFWLW